MTPAFPKRGPDAGTMDQVRPQCGPWHQNTLIVDWPTYPLQTPSGGGLRADPGQKQDPGERMLASGKEGLTNRGPLQKPALERSGNAGRAVPDFRCAPIRARALSPSGLSCTAG